jgi:3-hydroxyisobutyrate dehydrogenase-like beta-hydroxyacid dehydrogenase
MATRDLAAQLSERGVRMLDAPVSGGVSGARKGTLTVMVGGAKDDVDGVQSVFEPFDRAVLVGEIGAGDAVKALNNLMSATSLWITGRSTSTMAVIAWSAEQTAGETGHDPRALAIGCRVQAVPRGRDDAPAVLSGH